MSSATKRALALAVALLLAPCLLAGTAPGAHAKELKLIMANYIPPAYLDVHGMAMSFVNYVNQHGKGKVRIEYYHSGSLLKAKELMPGLLAGTADCIMHTDSYISSSFPILGIMELPFLYKSTQVSLEKNRVGTPLYNLINQELSKKNIFMLANTGAIAQYIWTKKKPVRKPGDLKGLRIRTAGRVEAQVIKALGGAPTTLASAEVYEALQRGTIDGVLGYPGIVAGRSLYEVLGYATAGYFASYTQQVYFRKDRWEALPEEVRKLLVDAAKHYAQAGLDHALKIIDGKYIPMAKKKIQFVDLTPDEEKAFRDACKPIWDWWKKQLPAGIGDKAIELATK